MKLEDFKIISYRQEDGGGSQKSRTFPAATPLWKRAKLL
jgi:hypothetical protein